MNASHVIAGLRQRYCAPEWALFTEVRSSTGMCDVLRTADAIAVNLYPMGSGWQIHGVEVKSSRADWLREIKRPEKSGPIKLFCSGWYLAVPAPWKRILLSLNELPERWGLLEIGTGKPNVVRVAEEREAEEPTPGFVRALLRAAARAPDAGDDGEGAGAAPLVEINRPALSRQHIGLGCGHAAPRPLAKVLPPRVRCAGCAAGRPTDREIVEAAIDDATEDDLRAYSARIHAELDARHPPLVLRLGSASMPARRPERRSAGGPR